MCRSQATVTHRGSADAAPLRSDPPPDGPRRIGPPLSRPLPARTHPDRAADPDREPWAVGAASDTGPVQVFVSPAPHQTGSDPPDRRTEPAPTTDRTESCYQSRTLPPAVSSSSVRRSDRNSPENRLESHDSNNPHCQLLRPRMAPGGSTIASNTTQPSTPLTIRSRRPGRVAPGPRIDHRRSCAGDRPGASVYQIHELHELHELHGRPVGRVPSIGRLACQDRRLHDAAENRPDPSEFVAGAHGCHETPARQPWQPSEVTGRAPNAGRASGTSPIPSASGTRRPSGTGSDDVRRAARPDHGGKGSRP